MTSDNVPGAVPAAPSSGGAEATAPTGRLGLGWLVAILAGLVGVIVVALVIRPLDTTTIDPDAAASVLYFQRLVAGQRLEAFVPTTPKPLLTLVDGTTWSLLHDWRALTWETLLAFGVAVILAVRWLDGVGRSLVAEPRLRFIAGPVAAGFGPRPWLPPRTSSSRCRGRTRSSGRSRAG